VSNDVWILPEDENYAVEFLEGGRWLRRMEYGTLASMKKVAQSLNSRDAIRVVKVSRYDPHPATAVVFYMEAQR
jgi:hypothetical protein